MYESANHEPENDALLFNNAARLLGRLGYGDIAFDIGGKKSKRRYIRGASPDGEERVIWVKASTLWSDLGEVVRFPWRKLKGSPDGERAVAVACDEAAQRGATHLLAVSGDPKTGTLSAAQLYPLASVPALVTQQAAAIDNVFYRAHSSSLVLVAYSTELASAAATAAAQGENLLTAAQAVSSKASLASSPRRTRSENGYTRNAKVRATVLKFAAGRCECCREIGLLTESGEHYLETHHVVGVGERGPDAEANIVALCPLCHRKAHFSADKIGIEMRLLEALRRRNRRGARLNISLDADTQRMAAASPLELLAPK
jgi:5-methylcytosine-specific restriction endonuclease McrA